jgi:hypothetical protein
MHGPVTLAGGCTQVLRLTVEDILGEEKTRALGCEAGPLKSCLDGNDAGPWHLAELARRWDAWQV